jgi:putative phosphoribosyl transferase
LLFDLLTDEESQDRGNVFDIEFLSQRLVAATRWLRQQPEVMDAPLGYFGASTGVAAALLASAKLLPFENVYSIVSRGGRPDLAGKALSIVKVPTLLLVGGLDYGVIELNQKAQSQLENSKLSIIPGATHLFDEPGTLEEVSHQAATWFAKGLKHKKNLRRRSEKHNFPPNH